MGANRPRSDKFRCHSLIVDLFVAGELAVSQVVSMPQDTHRVAVPERDARGDGDGFNGLFAGNPVGQGMRSRGMGGFLEFGHKIPDTALDLVDVDVARIDHICIDTQGGYIGCRIPFEPSFHIGIPDAAAIIPVRNDAVALVVLHQVQASNPRPTAPTGFMVFQA